MRPISLRALPSWMPCLQTLLAGGGLVGKMRFAHDLMQTPTQIKPLGLLQNVQGVTMNVDQYKLTGGHQSRKIPVIGVVGAAMNAGQNHYGGQPGVWTWPAGPEGGSFEDYRHGRFWGF